MLFKHSFVKQIYAPIQGTFVALCDVNDSTFNQGLMGQGL